MNAIEVYVAGLASAHYGEKLMDRFGVYQGSWTVSLS